MTHLGKRDDGLLLLEVLNKEFHKELTLVLELISSRKKNLPDVTSYEKKKAILIKTIDFSSFAVKQLLSNLKENLVNNIK